MTQVLHGVFHNFSYAVIIVACRMNILRHSPSICGYATAALQHPVALPSLHRALLTLPQGTLRPHMLPAWELYATVTSAEQGALAVPTCSPSTSTAWPPPPCPAAQCFW